MNRWPDMAALRARRAKKRQDILDGRISAARFQPPINNMSMRNAQWVRLFMVVLKIWSWWCSKSSRVQKFVLELEALRRI
jgi:hypothetical protein